MTVTLLNNPGGATLGGTLTVTAQDGEANFSNLTLDQPGNGYTLQVSSSGLTGATTSAIDVVPVVPTQLVVTTEPPRPVTAGSGFSLVVAAEDSSGYIATTFSDSVTVAISNNPGGSSLGGTLTVTAQNGVATFSDLTLNKVGNNYSLIVSASGVADGTTSGFNVAPAAATQLVVTASRPTRS